MAATRLLTLIIGEQVLERPAAAHKSTDPRDCVCFPPRAPLLAHFYQYKSLPPPLTGGEKK
jgi:hypothetical protein